MEHSRFQPRSFLPGFAAGIIVSAFISTQLLDLNPTSATVYVAEHAHLALRDSGTEDATTVTDDGVRFCHAPLDNGLLQRNDVDNSLFNETNAWMDTYIPSFINADHNGTGADSIAVAVVLPGGSIYEKGFGKLKANDTTATGDVDANTIYRMASLSKAFTALEAFILEQQGKLSMDGDIKNYLPDLVLPSGNNATWRVKLGMDVSDETAVQERKITPLQLASELSGLLRDEVVDQPWPIQLGLDLEVQQLMWANGTAQQVLNTIGESPASTGSWSFPLYSNMGFNLLGLVVSAVGNASYTDLIEQDIFSPLGMNSSSFSVPSSQYSNLAISSTDSNWSTIDVGAHNPAGGMYSSASDLGQFMSSLLGSQFLLDPATVRKWFTPLTQLDDDLTLVGAPWEIKTFMNASTTGVNATNTRLTTLYTKTGDFPGYHNLLVVDPTREYAFVILTSGAIPTIQEMGIEISQRYAAVVDAARSEILESVYAGTYSANDTSGNEMDIAVGDGSLWVTKLVVNQTDFMSSNPGIGVPIPGSSPAVTGLPLWPTSETNIFRFALATQPSNNAWEGCMTQWDTFGAVYSNGGIPYDIVAIENGKAMVPAAGVQLTKQ